MLEKRLWDTQHPLWQFPSLLENHYISKLEKFGLWPDQLYTMEPEVCPRDNTFSNVNLSASSGYPTVVLHCSTVELTSDVMKDIGSMLRHPSAGYKIKDVLKHLPALSLIHI